METRFRRMVETRFRRMVKQSLGAWWKKDLGEWWKQALNNKVLATQHETCHLGLYKCVYHNGWHTPLIEALKSGVFITV